MARNLNHSPPSSRPELARQLALFDTTSMVIGSIIGSGIFVVPSIVVAAVKDPSVALLSWIAGGVLTLFGAFTLAELSAAYPRTGGIYIYLRDAYGPLPAFLYGWNTFWVMQTGSIAAVSMVFGLYIAGLFHLSPIGVKLVAVSVISFLTLVNCLGVRYGSAVQNLSTLLKVAAIVGLVGLSLFLVKDSATTFDLAIAVPSRHAFVSFGTALIGILFAYEGWTFVTFVGGEVKNPERNLPRAIVLGMIVVIAVYVSANYSYLRVLRPNELASSPHVAADAAERLVGKLGSTFITLAILVSTFGATNSCILTGARSYYAMARDDLFFKLLGIVNPTYRTPVYSLVGQAAWSSILVLSGTYSQLFTYVIFIAWAFYALVAASLFVFRRKLDYPVAAYRTWGYPVTTGLFILAAVGLTFNTIIHQPYESLCGLGITMIGVPAFWYWRRKGQ